MAREDGESRAPSLRELEWWVGDVVLARAKWLLAMRFYNHARKREAALAEEILKLGKEHRLWKEIAARKADDVLAMMGGFARAQQTCRECEIAAERWLADVDAADAMGLPLPRPPKVLARKVRR